MPKTIESKPSLSLIPSYSVAFLRLGKLPVTKKSIRSTLPMILQHRGLASSGCLVLSFGVVAWPAVSFGFAGRAGAQGRQVMIRQIYHLFSMFPHRHCGGKILYEPLLVANQPSCFFMHSPDLMMGSMGHGPWYCGDMICADRGSHVRTMLTFNGSIPHKVVALSL